MHSVRGRGSSRSKRAPKRKSVHNDGFEAMFGATLRTPASVKVKAARSSPMPIRGLLSGTPMKRRKSVLGAKAASGKRPAISSLIGSEKEWRGGGGVEKRGVVQRSLNESLHATVHLDSALKAKVDLDTSATVAVSERFMMDSAEHRRDYDADRMARMRTRLLAVASVSEAKSKALEEDVENVDANEDAKHGEDSESRKARKGKAKAVAMSIELSAVDKASATASWFFGKVVTDQNAASGFALEGDSCVSVDADGGYGPFARVALDLSGHLQSPALLFAGQMTVVRGVNAIGDCIVASQFESSVTHGIGHSVRSQRLVSAGFTLLCASGPFSVGGAFEGSALHALCTEALTHRANVLLLTGPLFEGSLLREAPMTGDALFRQMVLAMVDFLEAAGHCCTVVLVPSPADAQHLSAYPQCPFSMEPLATRCLELVCLPNPCQFAVNNVRFAVNTADFVMDCLPFVHLLPKGGFEAERKKYRNWKQLLVASQCVAQSHFYPLEAAKMPLDYSLADALHMSEAPDVLVNPSKLALACDILPKTDTILLNTGPLLKASVGQCYALVTANASKPTLEPLRICDQIKIDIVHI